MNTFWENKLQRFWLIISAASLLLPLTSYFDNGNQSLEFGGVMTGILAVLFIFSLPFSILALPFLAGFRYGIELDMETMFGAYFFIVLLNAFGYVQWFWLIPKFFNRGKEFRLPTILQN